VLTRSCTDSPRGSFPTYTWSPSVRWRCFLPGIIAVQNSRFTIILSADIRAQAPLLLSLFSLIPSAAFSFLTSILYISLDLLAANALMQIAASGESGSSRLYTSPRKSVKWDSLAIGAA